MIRARNISPVTADNGFAQHSIILPFNVGASVASVIQAGWRAPFAGVIVSAHVYCATMTDADDSVRVDLKQNGATMLPATVDPVAADTTTSLAPSTTSFAAGDSLTILLLTGVGDAAVGNVILVVRPLLGTEAL